MNNEAYLKGVLDGDGFIDRKMIGLVTKSNFFIRNFQSALNKEGIETNIHDFKITKSTLGDRVLKTTSTFHRIRKVIPKELFTKILGFEAKTKDEKINYIRGFYQSEGCYCNYKGKYFYINFTNKNKALLKIIAQFLSDLGIKISGIYHRECKAEHWDNWQLYIYRQGEIEKFKQIIGEQK